jgi:hypothetical protein
VACMVENRNAYRGLVGKAEGKSFLGRHRHWWNDNTKRMLRRLGRRTGTSFVLRGIETSCGLL